jgi:ribosome-associated protein
MPQPPSKKPARSRPKSATKIAKEAKAAAAAKPAKPAKPTKAAKPAKPAKPATKDRSAAAKRSRVKTERTVAQVVRTALDDLKALDVTFLDVRHLTTLTDTMVVASGRSDRHVRALAAEVVSQCKKAGFRPIGVEGQQSGEWVLVDLADVVVHVMLPRVRDFYSLEKLWDIKTRDEAAEANA